MTRARTTMEIHIPKVGKLTRYIRKFSKPSFDRGTTIVQVHIHQDPITRPMLEKMITLLNLPFAKDPSGTGNEELRWISIDLEWKRFAQPGDPDRDDADLCTPDDIQRLFVAITYRALSLRIKGCPEIVTAFLSIPHLGPFQADALEIFDSKELTSGQFANLGDMIQQNDKLNSLKLILQFGDGAHELFARLAHASANIEELDLMDSGNQRNDLADLAVGKKGSDGLVMKLLRNPQSKLKQLSLNRMGLKDHHLIAILQMIRTPQIEKLHFTLNNIQVHGILEFASVLPQMTSLKAVNFGINPWCNSSTDQSKVLTAFVQGMMENTSIVSLSGLDIHKERISDEDEIRYSPQAPLLLHCLAVNRAGRRILTSSKPIADGLWPLILERAGKVTFQMFPHDLTPKYTYKHHGGVNCIYYFLRNCPKISSFL